MSDVLEESNPVDGAGTKYHRDGIYLAHVTISSMAHDPGPSAASDLAVAQG